MERALVVYESMFGNTKQIAEAVAGGLSVDLVTDLVEVGEASASFEDDLVLLVVGGPTHAFGLTRPRTREDAARQADGNVVSERTGLREWLAGIDAVRGGIGGASFDTRIDKPRVPGSAARGAEKRLRRKGFHIVVPAVSFYVAGTKGPLLDGEIERARSWGEQVALQVAGQPRLNA
jgi:hypothetical protein